MQIKLNRIEGEPFVINFPYALDQVPLNNTIAFRVMDKHLIQWMLRKIDDKTLIRDRNYCIYLCARCIEEFLEIDLIDEIGLDVSDLLDDNGELLPEVLERHVKNRSEKFTVTNYDTLEDSLFTIYRFINNLLLSYKFRYKDKANFRFPWKGRIWEIPYVIKVLFSGKRVFSKFDIQQTVEILHVKKLLKDQYPDSKITEDNLQDYMDTHFSVFLKIISLTVWEYNVPMPKDDEALSNMCEERSDLFADIDTQLAWDIGFFLKTTIQNYHGTMNILTGLIPHSTKSVTN